MDKTTTMTTHRFLEMFTKASAGPKPVFVATSFNTSIAGNNPVIKIFPKYRLTEDIKSLEDANQECVVICDASYEPEFEEMLPEAIAAEFPEFPRNPGLPFKCPFTGLFSR